ncbi:hypothetical protein GOA59_09130 [Sinorhizobium meliloti]|nr:hypothetical protein [Sinorhizobium meliloti]MDW9551129.1 hypothetical protein [Sinorhizobium meliloti]MDW9605063.1 hypothetical protein [Sinorhizobium meliloti]MDW9619689.1 hypothetical protein [Sinorhizobium meliloti]MDW9672992.1 hypothetical protein [Sinorhizobium meliloti]
MEYIAGMTDIVFARDGSVAKIIGDSLHVPFGTPSDQPDHATRAVACSLELDAFACSFREHCQRRTSLTATRALEPTSEPPALAISEEKVFRLQRLQRYHQRRRTPGRETLRPITYCVRLRPSQSMRRLEVMSTLVPLTTDVLSCMRCRLLSASYPSSG